MAGTGQVATPLQERDILQHELDYRRERRHRIFVWASQILVAIIGGVIAAGLQPGPGMAVGARALASAVAVGLAGYAAAWWWRQREAGRVLHEKINDLDRQLQVSVPAAGGGPLERLGGFWTLVALAGVALVAIWLPRT